jgi:hypothetical protein
MKLQKSLTSSTLNNLLRNKLIQKLADRGPNYRASMYAGTTVINFLDMFDRDDDDVVIIKVNKDVYDPHLHNYLLICKYKIKQELIKKEFKEKIVLHLESADDLLRISKDTKEYKSTYGYVVRTTITITTL